MQLQWHVNMGEMFEYFTTLTPTPPLPLSRVAQEPPDRRHGPQPRPEQPGQPAAVRAGGGQHRVPQRGGEEVRGPVAHPRPVPRVQAEQAARLHHQHRHAGNL